MMTTNLCVIANVKQLRTGGSFGILLPFFQTSWGVGFLNSTIFNSFHSRVDFGTILEGLRNFGGGGGLNPPKPAPRYATAPPPDSSTISKLTLTLTVSLFFCRTERHTMTVTSQFPVATEGRLDGPQRRCGPFEAENYILSHTLNRTSVLRSASS